MNDDDDELDEEFASMAEALATIHRLTRQTNRLLWLAWFTNVFIAIGATFVWGHWYSAIGNWSIVVLFTYFYVLNHRYGYTFGLVRTKKDPW